MVAGGLGAPTESVAGIAAATLAPAVSYEIGQYFQDHKQQGSPAHILAHALLGGAVAAAGGNDVLTGALAAGGAEAAAPLLAQYLYGTTDPSQLTAEQKGTIDAIAGLAGSAVGAIAGNGAADVVSGGHAASTAVGNNYLTKQEKLYEIQFDKQCQGGDAQACEKRDALRAESLRRDAELLKACGEGGSGSAQCQNLLRAAGFALSDYPVDWLSKWLHPETDKALLSLLRDEAAGIDKLIQVARGKTAEEIKASDEYRQLVYKLGGDFLPVGGDVKSFVEAETKLDYLLAVVGVLGGDAFKALKHGDDVASAVDAAKAAERATGPVFKTTAEAAKAAEAMGFRKINETVHGQAVFFDGKQYITRDIDGHKGGAWKVADSVNDLRSKTTRTATYNADLSVKIDR
jgi:filamentous hemagglutinin